MSLDLRLFIDALLAESSDAIVGLNDQLHITHWSDSAARLFGYVAHEVEGRHIALLTPYGRQQEGAALTDTLRAGCRFEATKTMALSKSGVEFSVVVKGVPLSDGSDGGSMGALAIYREAQQLKGTAEAQQLRALVSSSDDAIISKDLNGIITQWNPGAERLFGWTEEEIIGRSMLTLIPPERHHEEATILRRLARGERVDHFETERLRKDGSTVCISVTISPIRDENGTVVGASKIARDIGLRVQAERVIQYHAMIDSVTGLLNRRAFGNELRETLRAAGNSSHRAALLLIDLDRFKAINDTMGHHAGDKVLKEVGQRIKRLVRGKDVVARLGGDEFTVLLSEVQSESETMAIATRISQAISEPYPLGGTTESLGGSVGVAIYPDDGNSPEQLIQHADEAMYGSKRAGGARATRLSAQEQAAAHDRMFLMADLHRAVPEQQLRLVYQPVRALHDGSNRRCEALVRWEHPSRGLISPSVFIPLAEEAGLLGSIGDWVFREATRQLADWRRRIDPRLQVSINLSPSQLRAGPRYFAAWALHLKQLQLPASAIIFEITEDMVVDQSRATSALLQHIRRRGAEIAIDDFGTGHSSLSLLSRLDVQYLKIDQSFIRSMTRGDRDQALVEAITTMAQKLRLKVVAEGVETEAEGMLLQAMGCDYAQGYLYARPQSAAMVESCFASDGELVDEARNLVQP